MPEDKTQENFTDPDSRIMKRAGGGFDPAYNAQTAVDEAAHIIVAAELDNTAPDANWLLPMIRAVGDNLGELPALGLADGLPQAQVDRRPTERVDQERAGVPAVQHAGAAPGARRVEARVHGAEPAANGGAQHKLNGAKALVGLTGASLAEGGWRVRSNTLELPLGGGSGERCVKAAG